MKLFSKYDIILWTASVFLIAGSFIIFPGSGMLTLIASILGVSAIIINAKGHPLGQFMMIIFSVLYGIISWSFSYYGEMATYLGMTGPMALFSFISWLRNPYKKGKAEVRVNTLKLPEVILMSMLTAAVTYIFYHILAFFGTANLSLSTLSVSTSFIAVYLTFRRSAFFSLAYAANDVILILLWSLASLTDTGYISVVICFALFLACDIYGFISWKKMKLRQNEENLSHNH